MRFQLERHCDTICAVVFAPLTVSDVQIIRNENVNRVEIVDGKGWSGGSIAFIENLDFIESLVVCSLFVSADNLAAVNSLSQLRELTVTTRCKTPIDFSKFVRLVRCGLLWRDGCESLFDSQHLQSLTLTQYRKPKLPVLCLPQMQSLQVLDSSLKSLDFLTSLVHLDRLRLGALYRLEDTDHIRRLGHLWHLDISACKGFRLLDAVAQIKSLRSLLLNDQKEIESLQPLKSLHSLEALFFCGTTKVLDGKVNFLRDLPKLKCISFNNRRHYDCKCESFPQHYAPYPFSIQA